MARRSGPPDAYCHVTGKRKYSSKRQARLGLRRMSDKLGVYLCPHCHTYHLRNQHRASRTGASTSMPKSKSSKKRKKGRNGKRKKTPDCDFCLSRGVGVGTFLQRRICMDCIGLLKKGPWGRHKLVSALEEAARIRAQEQRERG